MTSTSLLIAGRTALSVRKSSIVDIQNEGSLIKWIVNPIHHPSFNGAEWDALNKLGGEIDEWEHLNVLGLYCHDHIRPIETAAATVMNLYPHFLNAREKYPTNLSASPWSIKLVGWNYKNRCPR